MEAIHEFTLILEGISEITPEIMNALFESGCDDATVSQCNGTVSMDFDRACPTMEDAIASAVRDVLRADIGVSALRLESEPGSTREGEVRRLIGA